MSNSDNKYNLVDGIESSLFYRSSDGKRIVEQKHLVYEQLTDNDDYRRFLIIRDSSKDGEIVEIYRFKKDTVMCKNSKEYSEFLDLLKIAKDNRTLSKLDDRTVGIVVQLPSKYSIYNKDSVLDKDKKISNVSLSNLSKKGLNELKMIVS